MKIVFFCSICGVYGEIYISVGTKIRVAIGKDETFESFAELQSKVDILISARTVQ